MSQRVMQVCVVRSERDKLVVVLVAVVVMPFFFFYRVTFQDRIPVNRLSTLVERLMCG